MAKVLSIDHLDTARSRIGNEGATIQKVDTSMVVVTFCLNEVAGRCTGETSGVVADPLMRLKAWSLWQRPLQDG